MMELIGIRSMVSDLQRQLRDRMMIFNQKLIQGTLNPHKELHVTRSKSDSYGDTHPNPSDSPPLEMYMEDSH